MEFFQLLNINPFLKKLIISNLDNLSFVQIIWSFWSLFSSLLSYQGYFSLFWHFQGWAVLFPYVLWMFLNFSVWFNFGFSNTSKIAYVFETAFLRQCMCVYQASFTIKFKVISNKVGQWRNPLPAIYII